MKSDTDLAKLVCLKANELCQALVEAEAAGLDVNIRIETLFKYNRTEWRPVIAISRPIVR